MDSRYVTMVFTCGHTLTISNSKDLLTAPTPVVNLPLSPLPGRSTLQSMPIPTSITKRVASQCISCLDPTKKQRKCTCADTMCEGGCGGAWDGPCLGDCLDTCDDEDCDGTDWFIDWRCDGDCYLTCDGNCIFTMYRYKVIRELQCLRWPISLARVWNDIQLISLMEDDGDDVIAIPLQGPVQKWVKEWPQVYYYRHDRSGWPKSVGFGEKTMYEVLSQEE